MTSVQSDVVLVKPQATLAIAARHDQGRAGQGHAGQVAGRHLAPSMQPGLEPGAGHAQAEVHVVRQHGVAVRGMGGGDGEVVGADVAASGAPAVTAGHLGGTQGCGPGRGWHGHRVHTRVIQRGLVVAAVLGQGRHTSRAGPGCAARPWPARRALSALQVEVHAGA